MWGMIREDSCACCSPMATRRYSCTVPLQSKTEEDSQEVKINIYHTEFSSNMNNTVSILWASVCTEGISDGIMGQYILISQPLWRLPSLGPLGGHKLPIQSRPSVVCSSNNIAIVYGIFPPLSFHQHIVIWIPYSTSPLVKYGSVKWQANDGSQT
jgi:hypothetical protein